MTYRHAGSQPVYAPNSYGGPEADPERAGAVAWSVASGELGRYAYVKHAEDDDFGQAGTLVRQVMDDDDRDHLVTNIVGHASDHVTDEIQLRVIAYWTSVDVRPARELPRASDSTSTRMPSRRQPEWLSHTRSGRGYMFARAIAG